MLSVLSVQNQMQSASMSTCVYTADCICSLAFYTCLKMSMLAAVSITNCLYSLPAVVSTSVKNFAYRKLKIK